MTDSGAPPTVATNPGNATVNVTLLPPLTTTISTTFTATATGSPAVRVQWQVSVDGGVAWTNVARATTTTLRVVVAKKTGGLLDGNRYRALFTNTAGQAVSEVATLTVISPPVIA